MKNIMLLAAVITAAMFTTVSTVRAETISDLPAGKYDIDPTHASVTWKVSHMGLSNYTARFTKFDASIELNPAALEKSTVHAKIDASSIRTDYPYPEKKDFDKKIITGEDWFNAPAFPTISFVSKNIEITGEKTGIVTGDLTFLGVTKPVALDVVFNGAMAEHPYKKVAALGFSATATLTRSDFGMDIYTPSIGDEVSVIIEAEFIKADK
jgi:polyisoprenoid-binding protein YceI